jgi:hypothetical protein
VDNKVKARLTALKFRKKPRKEKKEGLGDLIMGMVKRGEVKAK